MPFPEQHLLDRCAHIPTPFLVVDLEAGQRNIDLMARIVSATSIRLRPHFKAHKCPEIIRMQLEVPQTVGATCQTVVEAAVLAETGCEDILLTNQIVDPRTANALVQLPQNVTLGVLIDRPEQVAVIGDSAAAARRSISAYIEIDVGLGRGGFKADDPGVASAVEMIEMHPHLTLAGVQAYEGHVVLEPDAALRSRVSADAHQQAAGFRDQISGMVGRPLLLTGGGTGTAQQIASTGALDEIQCGSYVLMDAAYGRLRLPFEPALFCVASVLSAHPDGRVVLDAGMKSLSGDGLPRSLTSQLEVIGLSDEHSRAVQEGSRVGTGDRVLIQPWHVDPTMNLHREVVVVDGDRPTRNTPIRGHHTVGG